MRLTAIKLAGFKSFVDPITFQAPTNLTGIVGPNGCGKSNIIDAVRWVMGEISAKVLRGESMTDVIFSGSSARKPVGSAMVELIFDNSDGQIGGEYAGYNEISVKREVSRDAQSNYYLNGSRCRRKDIMDLFLGTGLGPRSYSIIEQGMISQIVDSKPEEVRAFLEEAAGISKYKERRRETERRISHTRDNLDRLSDLREEIGKQLNKLKRQANAAERWKQYKSEYRKIEGQVLALGWRDLTAKGEAQQKRLAEKRNQLEKLNAEQRKKEAELEQLRSDQHEATEAFNKRQSAVYEVGGEIARVEQGIQHAREIREKQQSEFEETEANVAELEQHLVLDKTQVEKLTTELGELEPRLKDRSDAEATARDTALETRETLQSARAELEQQREQAGDALRRADVLKARIEHHDQRIRAAMARREELQQEQKDLSGQGVGTDAADQSPLQAKAKAAAAEESSQQKSLERQRREYQSTREQIQQLREELDQTRSRHSRLEGEAKSLQSLQQAAVDAGESARDWYQSEGLSKAPALADRLKVDKGWERIVEAVLGEALSARLVDKLNSHSSKLDAAEGADVWLMEGGQSKGAAGTLAARVQGPTAVVTALECIQTAENLQQASAKQAALKPGESVITVNGEWLGPGWARRVGDASSEDSVLARAERLQKVEQALKAAEQSLTRLQNKLDDLQAKRQRDEVALESEQQAYREAANRHATAKSELASSQRRSEEMQQRAERVNRQLQEMAEQIETSETEQRQDRQELDELGDRLAGFENERAELDKARQTAESAHRSADDELQTIRDQRMELALKVEGGRASLDSLRQSIGRMDNQLGQLQQRYMQLSEQINRDEAPEAPLQVQLEKLLERKVAAEAALTEARAGLQGLESDYREKDQIRVQAVQAADELRSELEQQRLSQREVELKAQGLAERVEELGEDLEALVKALPEDADRAEWDAELEKLNQRIQRLEPVNLAAIQEHEQESERKEYLDAQHEDLQQALQTLEEAIGRIDRKTRTQFKETFEQVNKGMQALFPRLFGGGHAYLELTGDDLLTTGVAIMARPPGKRVSSIHLLSGGEKALTAVALVFAIFQLNPAPFCLLDEVDAPLDDANVGRFSDMVREMSEQVQFVFVTHNKITMEMANQLCGVTMREPGVSRLVSVDIAEATELAQTA